MKINQHPLTYLAVLLITIAACHKPFEVRTDGGHSASGDPVMLPYREYFWGQPWITTSGGYEIVLDVPKLSDSVINKGITVGLAVSSDWDPFVIIPFDYYDANRNDTIHLSYEAIPGQLKVIARAPFEIKYPSDVYITYK